MIDVDATNLKLKSLNYLLLVQQQMIITVFTGGSFFHIFVQKTVFFKGKVPSAPSEEIKTTKFSESVNEKTT